MHKQFPLAAIVEQVLHAHPSGANRQRNETTNYTTVTLKELTRLTKNNLEQYCTDFGVLPPKNLGDATIRRLGKAPNANFRAAKNYKNIVAFRTAPRDNNRTKWHHDFHMTAATVNLFSEMSSFFDGDCVFFSVDNKNKVRFGAPVNVNTTRPRGLFLEDNMPSMPDHSFPTRDAKIVPMGYMNVLDRRVRHSSYSGFGGLKYVQVLSGVCTTRNVHIYCSVLLVS